MGPRLYVGNLPFSAEEQQVRDLFSQNNRTVTEVKLITDRETGRPRGFGFVEMGSSEEADAATADAIRDALLQQGAQANGAAKTFLGEFAAQKGISTGSLEDNGMLAAESAGLHMMLAPLDDRPMVLATIEIDVDLRDDPELARTFLRANLDWTATGGGTFASLGDDEKPHLCRLIFIQPGATDAFAEEIAAMFNVVNAWLDALEMDEDDPADEENTISNAWLKA